MISIGDNLGEPPVISIHDKSNSTPEIYIDVKLEPTLMTCIAITNVEPKRFTLQ